MVYNLFKGLILAQINKLTALQIKKAKPKKREYRLSDGRGLYLRVYPNGTKSFTLIQTIDKKPVKLTLGLTTEITLEQARKIADEKILEVKNIPAEYRDRRVTFKSAFDEYVAFNQTRWSDRMKDKVKRYTRLFYYKLNDMPLAEIRRKDILEALNSLIMNNTKEYFKGVKVILSVFFGWAVQKEYCEHNIIRDIEVKYFFAKCTRQHYNHFKELDEIIDFKNTLCNCGSRYDLKLIMLLQLYTAVRPSEARLASWSEFNLEKGTWTIPSNRMKMRKPHEVVLSKQILKALKDFKKLKEQNNKKVEGYCFKNQCDKTFSAQALLKMIEYAGYGLKISAHGLRGTFATIANELRAEHGFRNDIVQACLAHETQNEVASAYNHAEYKKERATLLQWWADKLGDIDLEILKNTSRFC